jgi:hypothetical protein
MVSVLCLNLEIDDQMVIFIMVLDSSQACLFKII